MTRRSRYSNVSPLCKPKYQEEFVEIISAQDSLVVFLFQRDVGFLECRPPCFVPPSRTLLYTSNRHADLKGGEEAENEGVVHVL